MVCLLSCFVSFCRTNTCLLSFHMPNTHRAPSLALFKASMHVCQREMKEEDIAFPNRVLAPATFSFDYTSTCALGILNSPGKSSSLVSSELSSAVHPRILGIE